MSEAKVSPEVERLLQSRTRRPAIRLAIVLRAIKGARETTFPCHSNLPRQDEFHFKS